MSSELVQKAVASIEEADTDKPFGGFTAVLSTPSLDRDGDRLQRDEWLEPLPDRLPLDVDHGMSVADTIGSFRPYFDGEKMMMDATFASTPKAQEVRTLIKEGHINSVSIAFMSDKSKKEKGGAFREVLNAGVVSCPSNRDSLIMASKAATALADTIRDQDVDPDELRKALNISAHPAKDGKEEGEDTRTVGEVISDLFNFDGTKSVKAAGNEGALLQAIHDASAHLGALCVQLQQEEGAEESSESGKSITFRTADDEFVSFTTAESAREFCTEMLKSLDDAAEAGETLSEVHLTKDFDEAFDEVVKTATDEVETPEDTPADESATAAEEAAVPDEKAVESEAIRKAKHLELLLFASD